MPTKRIIQKTKKNSFSSIFEGTKKVIVGIAKAIWATFVQIGITLKAILVVVEKTLKIVAIFIIAISSSILFLMASLYLFSATFGLKESPAFQELRDRVAEVYSMAVSDELDEFEEEVKANSSQKDGGGVTIVQ